MLHVTTAIRLRKYQERMHADEMAEWQTRTIAMFTAATALVDGDTNPLLDQAHDIKLYADEEDVDDTSSQPTSGHTSAAPVAAATNKPVTALFDPERVDKDGDPIRLDTVSADDLDLPVGSYEKLLGGFGKVSPEDWG